VNGLLISMAVALVLTLVVLGVVAAKNEKLRTKLAGVGLAIAGALAAIVAVLTLRREVDRAKEVSSSTKQIKHGREDAEADAKETERAIEREVAVEAETHKEAVSEQDELKEMKRERLKT
jgi:uncharacterized protein YaiL (DUF2058 family)